MLTSRWGSVSGEFGWLNGENRGKKQPQFAWRVLRKRESVGEREFPNFARDKK